MEREWLFQRATAAQCRARAEECRALAKGHSTNREHQVMLQHIADTWERIAKDIESENGSQKLVLLLSSLDAIF